MKRYVLVAILGIALMAGGCVQKAFTRDEIDITMEPEYNTEFTAYAANTILLKFHVTDGGDPVGHTSLHYRVLPEEAGKVMSLTNLTDDRGLDMVQYYQVKPINDPGQEVIIEASLGDYTEQFPLAMLPYRPVDAGDMVLFFDEEKENMDKAENLLDAARLAYDMTDYYECLTEVNLAEACLDYTDNITDTDREARIRREIARYRGLVTSAITWPERPEVVSEPIVLKGITFATGKWEIRSVFEPVLAETAQVLLDNPDVRIRISGHTDARPIPMGNYLLSVKRAQSVKNYLVENYGVDTARISIQGFGPDKPIASNDTEEGMAQNRRIEYEIISSE